MICASAWLNRPRTFTWPWPPQPTMAMLIFSLGATNFGPPRTCRGTREKPATVAAVAARNLRRVSGEVESSAFFITEFTLQGCSLLVIGDSGDILVKGKMREHALGC